MRSLEQSTNIEKHNRTRLNWYSNKNNNNNNCNNQRTYTPSTLDWLSLSFVWMSVSYQRREMSESAVVLESDGAGDGIIWARCRSLVVWTQRDICIPSQQIDLSAIEDWWSASPVTIRMIVGFSQVTNFVYCCCCLEQQQTVDLSLEPQVNHRTSHLSQMFFLDDAKPWHTCSAASIG